MRRTLGKIVLPFVASTLLSIVLPVVQAGTLYKWVDKQGVIHLSDIPPRQSELATLKLYRTGGDMAASTVPGESISPNGEDLASLENQREGPAAAEGEEGQTASGPVLDASVSNLVGYEPYYAAGRVDQRIVKSLYNQIRSVMDESGTLGLRRFRESLENEPLKLEQVQQRIQARVLEMTEMDTSDYGENQVSVLEDLVLLDNYLATLVQILGDMLDDPSQAAELLTAAKDIWAETERVDQQLEPYFPMSE